MTLVGKENIRVGSKMSDVTVPPLEGDAALRAAELLKKKQELEAELRKIESELEKSGSSSTVKFEDGLSSGFSPITPKKRRFLHGFSPKNRWDAFSSPTRSLNTGFDVSSVFDLTGTFVSGKKEAILAFDDDPKLAQLIDVKDIKEKRFCLGCVAGPAQEDVQTFLKSSGNIFGKRLSECNVVVYHEDMTNIPSFMRRRLMIAAMTGLDFIGLNELTKAEGSRSKNSSEMLQMIEECKSISKYIRQCYGAGMPKPLDGRIVAVYIADEKISQDVLDAVALLGGSTIVIGAKSKIPVGISHLIHDMRELKEKNSPVYHKINYNTFFKDLETEYDRLRVKSNE